MAIIRRENPGGSGGGGSIIDQKLTIYDSFDALRAIAAPVAGHFYWLLNNDWNMIYFVSTDNTSPDSAPNTLIAADGTRLKLIGSE